jgi:DNA-binding response OmpR family regulator
MAFPIFKKTQILVVEDDSSLRRILCDRLSAEKYHVIEASDGHAGLSEALLKHPDLILLDMMLPMTDGLSVLEELRKDIWGKTVKVIVMTNLKKQKELGEQLERFNIADYLEKADISLEEVLVKVEKALKKE